MKKSEDDKPLKFMKKIVAGMNKMTSFVPTGDSAISKKDQGSNNRQDDNKIKL